MKSKVVQQASCRTAVDHIKNFNNDDPDYKTFDKETVLQPGSSVL